jgi:acyl-CoA thioester hydrolase
VSSQLRHPLRVRYAECDPQGIVFNAHYDAWFDIALTELWRAALGSYGAMVERGIDVVVAEASVRYLAPARFDDELELGIGIERLGRTSIVSAHEVWRGGEQLAAGTTRHVCVDAQALRPEPIPEWLREALHPFRLGESVAASAT